MTGSMAMAGGWRDSITQMALKRLEEAERGFYSPAKSLYNTGILLTTGMIVGGLNGYFGNPKVAGVVGVDAVVGTLLAFATVMGGYSNTVRNKVGDMALDVSHTVANALLMNYVSKVFNGFGVLLAAGSKSTSPELMAGVGALSAEEAAAYVHG